MITTTSLKHPTIQQKLKDAMMVSRKKSINGAHSAVYIKNRKGEPVIRVAHTMGKDGGYSFYAGNRNIKKAVFAVLK